MQFSFCEIVIFLYKSYKYISFINSNISLVFKTFSQYVYFHGPLNNQWNFKNINMKY